ncbi:putative glucan endo-1,3-beta-glucosidase [Metarhizium anisopliae]
MLKVGNTGNVGTAEMQDLILSSNGPTPGAILMECNIQEKDKGNAASWDVHIRLGGAVRTELMPVECPPNTRGTNSPNLQVALSGKLPRISRTSGHRLRITRWMAQI